MADAEHRVDAIQGKILHVYDGIEEADNQLPLWWLWTFYLAIAFAVFYWIAYHELRTAPLPMEAYSKAMQERASGGEVSEELLTALVADPDAVGEGQRLFAESCAVCHEARGQGNIGPNLTDQYWIHGGGPLDIHRTISDGVLDSGMPAWSAALGGAAVQRLAAYVLSIRGQNLDGKEPQGEIWTGGGEATAPDDAAERPDDAEQPAGERTVADDSNGEPTAGPNTDPDTDPAAQLEVERSPDAVGTEG